MRRLIPVALAASLLLAGCGSSGGGLDGVKVDGATTPTVKVDKNFKATKTTTKILKKGSGHAIAKGDLATLDYVAVNGTTGDTFLSTFKSGKPETAIVETNYAPPGLIKGLVGRTVGSRVLIAMAPKDGFGDASQNFKLKATDTVVFLVDIVKAEAIPKLASGKAAKLPATLPQLTLNKDKQPAKFSKNDKTAPAPKTMQKFTTIEGSGAVVKTGQTAIFEYVGQIYPAGKVFDESWTRSELFISPLGAGQLIKCWDEGLVGQKLGSRVVLVCPADVAYGEKGSPPAIKGGDTLIFAVDLLAAF